MCLEKEDDIMKCLVTGATGHIGNVLVKNLYENHYQVTALVLPKDSVRMIEPYCDIVEGNVLDRDSMFDLVKGYDVVFHLAGIVEIGSGKKKTLMAVNFMGTKNVFDACVVNNIGKFVYTSSVHAIEEKPFGETITETKIFDPARVHGLYGKSKAKASDYVMTHYSGNTKVIVVMPSGVIGPYDYQRSNISQMFVDILLGHLTAYVKGGYNFVDVRDVANGIRQAMEKGKDHETYLLTGNEITVKELLDKTTNYIGRKPIKTKVAAWFLLAVSYLAEFYYIVLRQKPLFTHYSIVVLRSNYAFSNEKAKQELGYTVRGIDESIKDSIDFVKNNFVEKKGKKFKKKIIAN